MKQFHFWIQLHLHPWMCRRNFVRAFGSKNKNVLKSSGQPRIGDNARAGRINDFRNFMNRQSLPVRDYVVSIKDEPSLLNKMSKFLLLHLGREGIDEKSVIKICFFYLIYSQGSAVHEILSKLNIPEPGIWWNTLPQLMKFQQCTSCHHYCSRRFHCIWSSEWMQLCHQQLHCKHIRHHSKYIQPGCLHCW